MCTIKYFFLLSNPEKQIGVKRKRMRSLSGIYRERKRMFTGYSLFVHEINSGIMKWKQN